jgi:cyclopropane-fatty-acyl-phospholipid synthase
MTFIDIAEKGFVPDFLIRYGIRRLLAKRLRDESAAGKEETIIPFLEELKTLPLAIETGKANEQHYEIPADYFHQVLGPRLKYSSTYWPLEATSLAESEEVMLNLTAERADIKDGQKILELGCGWGSFSLWAAQKYPNSDITGVSNSNSQRDWIESQAKDRGLNNLRIITADMNSFEPESKYDRIVSIEMFEHMKNYAQLLKRISNWLVSDGCLFVHIFTHRLFAYHFEDGGVEDDWMARYFFSGGTMPSDHLLLYFQDDLKIEGHWRVNGTHYSRTLEAWLKRQDIASKEVMRIFRKTDPSEKEAKLWLQRWRIFYMACSELFRYRGGEEWFISHYRFRRR